VEEDMHTHRWFIPCAALALLAAASAQAQDQVAHFTTADGRPVTLHSGQPAPDHYGSPPAFGQLDTNHDGYISLAEAEAYPPLVNDFEEAVHHGDRVSKAQYAHWVQIWNR
jgi:hypothetical protein